MSAATETFLWLSPVAIFALAWGFKSFCEWVIDLRQPGSYTRIVDLMEANSALTAETADLRRALDEARAELAQRNEYR